MSALDIELGNLATRTIHWSNYFCLQLNWVASQRSGSFTWIKRLGNFRVAIHTWKAGRITWRTGNSEMHLFNDWLSCSQCIIWLQLFSMHYLAGAILSASFGKCWASLISWIVSYSLYSLCIHYIFIVIFMVMRVFSIR